MARSGVGSMHFIDGSLKSDGYISIIEQYVKQNGRVLAGNHLFFSKAMLLATHKKRSNIFLRTK